ncbi:hypothetical protein TSUD_107690 [Trifolium subterraneum]|uniref:Uncharacterized protein n=1 Tax=Trifolium subterraneum TaxID=3900 RepID=A0A2Z6N6J4_TRISU|nr:hypothetical protein TSUD_107690 [Trifolium subterraneum]
MNSSYDFSNMVTFLNMKTVREALGVGDLEFIFVNNTVNNAMLEDWMKNLEVGIPVLLEDGIKLLVYAGEYDLICNWLGNSRWVDAMKWLNDTSRKQTTGRTKAGVDAREGTGAEATGIGQQVGRPWKFF